MPEISFERDEPKGCTLADLMALTLGVAVASSQYWYSWRPQATTIAGVPAPTWYVWSNFMLECIYKSCVALIPVILQRRMRFGGPLKPVDYWVLVTGFSILSTTLWNLPSLGIVYSDSSRSSQRLVNLDAYQVWKAGKLELGLVAILVMMRIRKQVPNWINGVLIALGWTCLTYVATLYLQDWGNAWLQSLSLRRPLPNVFLLSVLIQGPLAILTALPLAFVFVDLVRSQDHKRLWIEKFSIAIPLSLTLGASHCLPLSN